jgi:hypothetical protein
VGAQEAATSPISPSRIAVMVLDCIHFDNLTGSMEEPAAFGGDCVFQIGAPRPMKMGTIVSLWRYDTAASHARAPLKHPIAYDLALRPRAAIFQRHGRLGWALIHPRNRVYVGLSEETRRSDFGAVKTVVDPTRT